MIWSKKKEEEHRAFMKSIKENRTKLETFIIGYLDKIDEEFVKIGNNHQLTKIVKETKAPIKPDNIKQVLKEEFKQKGIAESDQQIDRMVEEFIMKIEEKRETKSKKTLSRSDPEKEVIKQQKKDEKKNIKLMKKQERENKKSVKSIIN